MKKINYKFVKKSEALDSKMANNMNKQFITIIIQLVNTPVKNFECTRERGMLVKF